MIKLENKDTEQFKKYSELLTVIAGLSKLFSDSTIPYINYRVMENIFCLAFNADNISRSDTSYDAKINTGIGLKTFILKKNHSIEKIAEFNANSHELNKFKDLELAETLASFKK